VVVAPPLDGCPAEPPWAFGGVDVTGVGASLGMAVSVGKGVVSGTAVGSRDGICLTGCDSDIALEPPVGCSNQSSPMAAETAHPLSPTPRTAAAVTHAAQPFEFLLSPTIFCPFELTHEL
jgi:hypothetical protein